MRHQHQQIYCTVVENTPTLENISRLHVTQLCTDQLAQKTPMLTDLKEFLKPYIIVAFSTQKQAHVPFYPLKMALEKTALLGTKHYSLYVLFVLNRKIQR